ncbi:hypothetical protein LHYA1_G009161 [Lachnellula hyalina]|uniref:Uncharacterized protein n=1 Tax=Lachnellula hyalina TaxID=1316788 RepID=A0A8H8QSU1_9HELO|nr:uncharacterized protein LHYA1_G009161 [Lachnellula hyalina]TVY22142.1 hypothetical protein LHYA1_G009161 [Lachnellula hyalina]
MLADWIDYYDLALLNTPGRLDQIWGKTFLLAAYSYILSSNLSLKSLEQIDIKRSYEATLNRLDNMAERYTSAILCAAHDAIP